MAPKKKNAKTTPKKTQPVQKSPQKAPQFKELFEKLAQGNPTINDETFFNFLSIQLEISADDIVVGHIVTNVMKLTKIEEVTYDQFEALFHYTNSKDEEDLKKKMNDLRGQASQDIHFKKLYKEVFNLYIGNHTTLDLDVAQQLWAVYLKNKFTYYKEWLAYLGSLEDKENKKVHKDLWNMVLEFAYDVKDINNCTEEDGWPLFLDDFVEFVRKGK